MWLVENKENIASPKCVNVLYVLPLNKLKRLEASLFETLILKQKKC